MTKLEKMVEDKDFFPFKYIGGGYFRQIGVPKKVKAEIIHAPEAIEYVKNKFKKILNELNKEQG